MCAHESFWCLIVTFIRVDGTRREVNNNNGNGRCKKETLFGKINVNVLTFRVNFE